VCKSQNALRREFQNGSTLGIFNQLLVDSEGFKCYVSRCLEFEVGQLTSRVKMGSQFYTIRFNDQIKLRSGSIYNHI
jgi:hypothetical protein